MHHTREVRLRHTAVRPRWQLQCPRCPTDPSRQLGGLLPHRDQKTVLWRHQYVLCIDELTYAAKGGHNAAAYVAAVLLYRANSGIVDDEIARQYMR